jgi:hypothetical protein
MNDATDLDRTDEGIASYDVSDEALEAAASADKGQAMTWVCTSIWWCGPGGM